MLVATLGRRSDAFAQRIATPDISRGGASWLLPTVGGRHGGPARFAARFAVAGTQAIIYLDSAIVSPQGRSPTWIPVDSIKVRVALNELMIASCGASADNLSALYVAVVRDSTDTLFNYPRPRVAWVLDTVERRIRPLNSSSVHCIQEYAGE